MFSKRSIRFPRRNPSRRLAAAGAAWLMAGLTLGTAWMAGPAADPAGTPAPAVVTAAATVSTSAGYSLTWTEAHPPASPPALREAVAAYDADTSSVVLFGGATTSGALSNDTWVWDGRTWTEHPASSMTQSPPARRDASMAFDPSLHQLILFGGEGSNGSFLGDTWAWNGASWYQLPPGPAGSPGARRGASLALGPNGNLVLFGGAGPVTASVPSPTTTPTTAPPGTAPAGPSNGGASPSAAVPAAAVLGDTWQWTTKGWAPSSAAGPSPRWGAAMAYDSTDRSTVLYSGDTAAPGDPPGLAGDTWTWNGTGWTRRSPKVSPPGRFDAIMSDDPAAGGALLVTGETGSGVLGDGWIWDGAGWSEPASTNRPGRAGAAGAYDRVRSATVVFAGAGAGGASLGDTELVATIAPVAAPPTTAAPSPTTVAVQPGSTPTSTTTKVPGHGSPTTTVPGHTSPTSTAQRSPGPTTASGSATGSPGPGVTSLQASRHDVRRGASVRLAGSGFAPDTPVTITFRSTPALVGRFVAGPSGRFTATVSVPDWASPGEHHFVAAGVTAQGRPATLLASVFVLAPGGPQGGTSRSVELAMVGLALLIPGGAWLAMTGAGWWRRRSWPLLSADQRPSDRPTISFMISVVPP